MVKVCVHFPFQFVPLLSSSFKHPLRENPIQSKLYFISSKRMVKIKSVDHVPFILSPFPYPCSFKHPLRVRVNRQCTHLFIYRNHMFPDPTKFNFLGTWNVVLTFHSRNKYIIIAINLGKNESKMTVRVRHIRYRGEKCYSI